VLLMSGDNRTPYYDEPNAMRRTAIRLGVPASAILTEPAGQRYHLDRAHFTCQSLGLDAAGYPADRRAYLG